jgi:hypothetical protein
MNGHGASNGLRVVVGAVAIAAPALHSLSDALEWQQGFTPLQLWINYTAFLPMPWLLLGLYAVREPRAGAAALTGALLYGVAFAYFMHTTLLALEEHIPTYEELWRRLGGTYTLHGAVMVAGGALFGFGALRARWSPRWPVLLFLAGIAMNFVLALLPAPDILQTFGSALRNVGIAGMGYAALRGAAKVSSRRRSALSRSACRPGGS